MKTITNLNEANSILKEFRNANACVRLFDLSHKKLGLKLSAPNNTDNVLYIVGVGCEHINGFFSWKNSNVTIENNNGDITKIIDKANGFELITSGGFSMAEGKESEFGN